ncbi:trimeric intracellular cation channel family protein [Desulfuribacillus alkaliarsenatis]|uniref:trimeric intracellular cation channel family protein n=1 Tax=Desulfuribacillus alkaliarsenatis TaxID=766136 RepID=UPI000AC7A15F|nr:trimeric intracellular cation channel family protein [Desulfuribacillus alkaliarsenatis]
MAISILSISEFVGTLAFAMSGALLGISKRLDYYGVVVLAVITALGGGMIRDVLIGNTPPMALTAPFFTIISIITAIMTIYFYQILNKHRSMIQLCDAFGLAAFTVMGASMATAYGYTSPFIVIFLALLTGTGGGTIRDIFVKEIPYVFRKEIYAVASMIGAVVYLLAYLHVTEVMAVYACFITTLTIRLLSIRFNLHLQVTKKTNEEEQDEWIQRKETV